MKLFDGATEIGSTTADGGGNWSIITSVLSEGPHSITAVATDAAGNSSTASGSIVVDIDTTAPQAGTLSFVGLTDTGSSDAVPVTQDNDFSLSLTGQEPGSVAYEVSTDGGATWTNTSNVQSGLADGSYQFRAAMVDLAGNSGTSAPISFVIDNAAPTITSANATALNENSGAGQVVYTVGATDTGTPVTYGLGSGGGDEGLFSINSTTGAVTLTGNPDAETKSTYSFVVTATDAAGNHSQQTVTLTVNNLDEVAPTITSGATAAAIDENSGASQVVYTVTATDTGDISGGVTYSIKDGAGDFDAFSIDANTGQVTLTADPNFEGKPGYGFTVVATDAAGHVTEQAVTLAINNLDEVAPVITSGLGRHGDRREPTVLARWSTRRSQRISSTPAVGSPTASRTSTTSAPSASMSTPAQ